ncbi:hypothetical protein PVAND_006513 [Polypedilum vanderplanki]|uniref:Uncharacterized protein n=1 Tax=Polypedilum vanderplanki TaxID=319348 RepID=A0A9J6C3W0_POLVA|nr:hypothetical protein PVAND_006513 [Polypedilum vanderplanki]
MPETDALKTEIVKDQRVDITTITQTFITTERFDTSSEPIELPSKEVTDIIHDENDNEPTSENVFIETTQDSTEQIPKIQKLPEKVEDESQQERSSKKKRKHKKKPSVEVSDDQTTESLPQEPHEELSESIEKVESTSAPESKSQKDDISTITQTFITTEITKVIEESLPQEIHTSSEPIELPSSEISEIIHDETDNEPIREYINYEPIEISSDEMPETDALKTEIVKDQRVDITTITQTFITTERFDTSSEPIELPSKNLPQEPHEELSESIEKVESTSAPESKSQKDDISTITQTFITTEITKVIEESLPQEIHTSSEPIRLPSKEVTNIIHDETDNEPIREYIINTVSEPIEISSNEMPETDALKTEIVKDQRVDITTITQTFITTERFDTSSEPIELPSKEVTDIIHDENDNEPISENVLIETHTRFY